MSTVGIQLNSEPQLAVFQPDVRQYLHKIQQAVLANDLPAARQAFAALAKSSNVTASSTGVRTQNPEDKQNQHIQALGRALQDGDPSEVSSAVEQLGQTLAASGVATSQPAPSADSQTPGNSNQDSSSEPNSQTMLNITA